MPWAYCKNSRRGRERGPAASPRPVRQRLGPWIVSHHASPQQTTNEGCEEQTWGGGASRGALQLKRLSSCKLKRHYLLTWRCPLWGCTLWCENTERVSEGKRKEKEKKEVWIVALTGNSADKKIVCWHGFWNIISSVCRITSDAPLTSWKCSMQHLSETSEECFKTKGHHAINIRNNETQRKAFSFKFFTKKLLTLRWNISK